MIKDLEARLQQQNLVNDATQPNKAAFEKSKAKVSHRNFLKRLRVLPIASMYRSLAGLPTRQLPRLVFLLYTGAANFDDTDHNVTTGYAIGRRTLVYAKPQARAEANIFGVPRSRRKITDG